MWEDRARPTAYPPVIRCIRWRSSGSPLWAAAGPDCCMCDASTLQRLRLPTLRQTRKFLHQILSIIPSNSSSCLLGFDPNPIKTRRGDSTDSLVQNPMEIPWKFDGNFDGNSIETRWKFIRKRRRRNRNGFKFEDPSFERRTRLNDLDGKSIIIPHII